MPDPRLPPNLADEIADLKRRLDNLERSPSIPFSSARGGAFLYLDENGGPRWVMGNVHVNADGNVGTSEQDVYGVMGFGDSSSAGFFLREGQRALAYPGQSFTFHDYQAFKAITSGSFVPVWNVQLDQVVGEVIKVVFFVGTDAATTGEVRLSDAVSGQTTTAYTTPANSGKFISYEWLHPATSGLFDNRVRNTRLDLRVDARRASGAGNVNVYLPDQGQIASTWTNPNADTNGHLVVT